MTREPICPQCGKPAKATTTRYGVRHSCCGLWSWDSKALTDRETHDARQAAHAAFDPLWKCGHMSRGEAYRLLQIETGLSSVDCHMSTMTAAQAQLVPTAVERIRARIHPSTGVPANV